MRNEKAPFVVSQTRPPDLASRYLPKSLKNKTISSSPLLYLFTILSISGVSLSWAIPAAASRRNIQLKREYASF